MIRDARRLIAAWNSVAKSADDAPLWAEVCGTLLAPALFVRAGVHVWIALLADVDPRLADGHDLSAHSPIRGLRGDRHDALARLGVVGVGVVALDAWAPSALLASAPAPIAVWIIAQIGALLAEPLLYGLTIQTRDVI